MVVLVHGFNLSLLLRNSSAVAPRLSVKCSNSMNKVSRRSIISISIGIGAISSAASALEEGESETLSNVPQTLSGECLLPKDCKKARIQKPKSRKAESCTTKCVGTCIRGGDGSPGEGPLNFRRPMVVFKQGFRTRQYCLVECSDICNLIGDGDDGPYP